jgi:glycosyltransferase involved in cell wall biosynthesis
MKKILIIMHDMGSGGAQKSLLSFLSEMGRFQDRYDISLLLMKKEGLFFSQIPPYIKLIKTPNALICMHSPITSKAFWKACDVKSLAAKIKWQFAQNQFRESDYGEKQQTWWDIWRRIIPESETCYDVAISYMHGYPNYYLVDKVQAKKKVMWIHTQYSESGRDVDFDGEYYAKADLIVTVSDTCARSFTNIFPGLKEKVCVIENISLNTLIWKMAEGSGKPEEYKTVQGKIIISIGRLSYEKGFDMALEAARILKDAGYLFKWFFIGKGPLLDELLKQRTRLGLEGCIEFLGEQANPYVYLHHADIFAQTSRIEGKSIVLDEAKILGKPIIVTDYETVKDNVRDKEQGLIVAIDSSAIAAGLRMLFDDPGLCLELANNLAARPADNIGELAKYLQLLDE